jgi:hypothetical protein
MEGVDYTGRDSIMIIEQIVYHGPPFGTLKGGT